MRLLALYADGSDVAIAEAEKLTLEMIAESATWLEVSDESARLSEIVRQWWVAKVREGIGGEEAEEFEQRWASAFEKARASGPAIAAPKPKTHAELKAEIEAERAEAARAIAANNTRVDAELAAEEAAAKAAVAAPAVVTKPALSPLLPGFEKLPEAPKPPPGATELERLTYPPGLLGHATDHAFRCTPFPNRQLALWGALAGLGKILDRKLIGPTGSSTVGFDLTLAASGAGKEYAIQFMLLLLRSAGQGYEKLFQGGMLASVQAVEDLIRVTPNCLVVIDEFGRWFRMIQDQSGNVSELPGVLWNYWGQKPEGRYGVIRRANREAKEQDVVQIQWPTLSLAGASVSEPFWDACGDEHISGGFLNRCLIFDVGIGSLDWLEPTRNPDQLEPWFVEAMQLVTRGQGPDQGATPIMTNFLAPFRMGWDDKVEEAYRDYVSTVRKLPEGRKRDLSIRTPEIAVRLATRAARWSGARNVSLSHFEWGWAWASHSRDKVLVGANERMKVKRDFDAVCRHVKNLLAEGPMRWMDIRTKSRSAAGSFGMEIVDKVMQEMIESGEVREIEKPEQLQRGLRKPVGAPGRWFELGRGR